MDLELQYDSQDAIPEAYRGLYTEKEGKFHFTGVKGMKTQADVDAVLTGARKERDEHKATKAKYAPWARLTGPEGEPFEKPEDVQALLDSIPTLKAAAEAGGSKSAEAVQKQVDAAKKTLSDGFAREKKALEDTNAKLTARVQRFEQNMRVDAVRNAVLDAMQESKIGKINPDAIEDVMLYAERHFEVDEERDDETGELIIKGVSTRDGVGVTPKLGVGAWLSEMQPKKGHWWLPSEGSGPKGSNTTNSSSNPWSYSGWNVTEQGKFLTQFGQEKAEQMARAAGTVLGGPRPMAPAGTQVRPVVMQPRRSAGGLRNR